MRIFQFCLLSLLLTCISCNSCSNDEPDIANSEENKIPIENNAVQETPQDSISDDMDTLKDVEAERMSDLIEKEEEKPALKKQSEGVKKEVKETAKEVEEEETVSTPSKANSESVVSFGDEVPEGYKYNLATFAANEVSIIREGQCAEDCGKVVYIQNYNEKQAIVAVVQANWKGESDKEKAMRMVTVKPNQQLELGCTESCTKEAIKIKWKIVSAEYK